MHTEDITEVCRYSILALLLLAFPGASLAADHYVWCGASGGKTGMDFTNAYTDLPVSLTRGDTYYVAGSTSCTYGAHTFDDALSGTSVISMVHATSSANSSVPGWQASFGATAATWNRAVAYGGGCGTSVWIIQQSYYTFEGKFGTIGTSEPTSGTFGFHVLQAGDCVDGIFFDGRTHAAVIYGITLNHTEIDGSPMNIGNVVYGAFAIQAVTQPGLNSVSGLSMYEDYAHDWESVFLHLHAAADLTVDHSWFARIMYSLSAHGNGASINPGVGQTASNLTFSNDTWEDACGTSVITAMNGTVSNLVIYGNTFFQSTNTVIFPGGTTPVFCNGDGQIGDLGSRGAVTTGAIIYNNTFYNNTTAGASGVFFTNPKSTNIVQTNNLFVNVQYVHVTTGGSGDAESYNTVVNKLTGGGFACGGPGDSCQGTPTAISSASVTSNVADVVIKSGHGLRLGSPVLVMGSQVKSTIPCGIDTYYPYPTVSEVVSKTEFRYTVKRKVPNATCQVAYGVFFGSPSAIPFTSTGKKNFTLSSETVDPHLHDGKPLPPPYNIDPNGTLRGGDGSWERGAYQFLGSQPPASVKD